jgi:drug/metabolite transporter (DMT)-like permease
MSAAVSRAERLTPRTVAGLVLGLAGVALLAWPKLSRGAVGDLRGEVALVLAVLIWSVASVWAKHATVSLAPFVAAGWQLLAGGALFVFFALLLGEPARLRWDAASLLAFGYLTVVGSCLGYGSYLWLLHHVPAARAATFAYVNPVVAVVLGWLLLAEPLGLFVILGTLVIVSAVVLTIVSRKAPGGG